MQIRTLPVLKDAIQWTGDNLQEVKDFIGTLLIGHEKDRGIIIITTSQGNRLLNQSDWIIKDVLSTTKILVINNETFNLFYEQVK